MRHEILALDDVAPALRAELAREYVVHPGWEEADAEAAIAAAGPRIDAILTSGTVGASAALIARLPRLAIICCFGVGHDGVDLAAARARGVVVTNCPGINHPDVADMAFALLLAVARRVPEGDRLVREGRWIAGDRPEVVPRVSGRRLGVLGLGAIGREVARRAEGFGMPVRYHNRRPRADVPYAHEPSLTALAAASDFLVVSCPATPETRHVVNAEVLAALGPKGFLINVARGSVVDTEALVAALRGGTIAGAALDVFEQEPIGPDVFAGVPNVVLSPHQAGTTEETFRGQAALTLENLRRCFAGLPVKTPVTGGA